MPRAGHGQATLEASHDCATAKGASSSSGQLARLFGALSP